MGLNAPHALPVLPLSSPLASISACLRPTVIIAAAIEEPTKAVAACPDAGVSSPFRFTDARPASCLAPAARLDATGDVFPLGGEEAVRCLAALSAAMWRRAGDAGAIPTRPCCGDGIADGAWTNVCLCVRVVPLLA